MYTALILLVMLLVRGTSGHAGEVANWWHLQRLRFQRFPSFDHAIAAFPPELRGNVLANFGTDSPQHADFASPRTILFSDNANLLVAIGGARCGQPTSNLMEVAEFNPLANRYIPHLIRYAPESQSLVFVENVNTVIPPGHPRHCARCHGENFRPIFDSYDMWPQSYGSGLWAFLQSDERQRWTDFSTHHRRTGYYAHLTGLEGTLYDREKANERLTHLLNANNERRIIQRLRSNPKVIEYAPEIFAVLASRGQTIKAPNYFPRALKEAFDLAQPRLRKDIQSAVHQNLKRKVDTYASLTGSSRDLKRVYDFDQSSERFYAELMFFMNLADVSVRDWPMTLAADTYSFADPTHPFEQFTYEFYTHVLAPHYPAAAKSFRFQRYDGSSPVRSDMGYPLVKLIVDDETAFNRALRDMLRDRHHCEKALTGRP